jgi:hypothetical protein
MVSLCLTKHHTNKSCGGTEVYLHVLLTSALGGREWPTSRSGHLIPGTRWIGECVVWTR